MSGTTTMENQIELLFFDTFSHANSEELNLDLVQFPKPVYVTEIRVIPLGARVQGDFPGGVRLGATHPSQFSVEFFVNDLGKPGASTFESLGNFAYNQNECINFVYDKDDKLRHIPTDGLVLKGFYNTITLAVYGKLTNLLSEPPQTVVPSAPVVPTPKAPVDVTASSDKPKTAEIPVQETPTKPSLVKPSESPESKPERLKDTTKKSYHYSDDETFHHEKRRYSKSPSRDKEYRKDSSRERERTERYKHVREPYEVDELRKRPPRTPPLIKRPRTPNEVDKMSVDDVESISDEEKEPTVSKRSVAKASDGEEEKFNALLSNRSADPEDQANLLEQLEPILSDEECDDMEQYPDLDFDYTEYLNNDDIIKIFNPFNADMNDYKLFSLPTHLQEIHAKNDTNESDLKEKINEYIHPAKSSLIHIHDLMALTNLSNFHDFNLTTKEQWIKDSDEIATILEADDPFARIMPLSTCENKTLRENETFQLAMETARLIVQWIKTGLNFDLAMSQEQTGCKIRHIKTGIRLAATCVANENFFKLINDDFDVQRTLLDVYDKEYMALSIRLMILRAIDRSVWHRRGIENFLSGKINGYETVTRLLVDKKPLVRVKYAIASILEKVHLHETLEHIHAIVSSKIHVEHLCSSVSEREMNEIEHGFAMVLTRFKNSFILAQPKRFLPVSAQFEINHDHVTNVLFALFRTGNFLANILALLAHKSCGGTFFTSTFAHILDVLEMMSESETGVEFLMENMEMTRLIVKILLHGSHIEEDALFSRYVRVGLLLTYRIKAYFHLKSIERDDIEHLHALVCLKFLILGRVCLADQTAMNLNVLTKHFDNANELYVSYATDLIHNAVMFASNVRYMENVDEIQKLLKIAAIFENDKNDGAKWSEIGSYLKPCVIAGYLNYDNMTPLCEVVKKSIGNVAKIPENLITAVKILEYICINDDETSFVELKYKYATIHLYAMDGLTDLLSVLQKINAYYELPNLHSSSFVSTQGAVLCQLILPCVKLIRRMLSYVINIRNSEFKDLTAIVTLLDVYTLMSAFPINAILYRHVTQIQQEVIETLLIFTQPCEDIHNDSLTKSLWTLMVGEVVKYITKLPHCFVPGLVIFSELLPLPLPVQTRNLALTDAEVSKIVNLRKLWSAHLHSLHHHIQDLVTTLMVANSQPLIHLLRRICIQMCDLAANTALVICRAILDFVIESCRAGYNASNLRVLTFLLSVVNHGAIKCAILKVDEKLTVLCEQFCTILATNTDTQVHLQIQECVINVIQTLCDNELTVLHVDGKADNSSDVYLANAMPTKDVLAVLLNALVNHLSASESNFATILPIIRTFLLLTEHDYGFYHLKSAFDKKRRAFFNVFVKLTVNFARNNTHYLSTLNAVVEFLKICLSADYETDANLMFAPRTMTMSRGDVRGVVGWDVASDEHPIEKLAKLLEGGEDETHATTRENVTGLLDILRNPSEEKVNFSEVTLPQPETLLNQYNARQIFVITHDILDERLSARYWLSVPSDEADLIDVEQVTVDLNEICQLLSGDIDLNYETERLLRVLPVGENSDDTKTIRNENKYVSGGDRLMRPFVTPSRGRGYVRSATVVQPRSTDLFRSRPPNTSRPPSLHVDDFVALETCGAQPTAPTGYNKLSRDMFNARAATSVRARPKPYAISDTHYRNLGRSATAWPSSHDTSSHYRRMDTSQIYSSSAMRSASILRGIPSRISRTCESPLVRHVRIYPR